MNYVRDRTMIEAQQRVVDVTPKPRIMPTSADRAITLFNQLIAKRSRALPQPWVESVRPAQVSLRDYVSG